MVGIAVHHQVTSERNACERQQSVRLAALPPAGAPRRPRRPDIVGAARVGARACHCCSAPITTALRPPGLSLSPMRACVPRCPASHGNDLPVRWPGARHRPACALPPKSGRARGAGAPGRALGHAAEDQQYFYIRLAHRLALQRAAR